MNTTGQSLSKLMDPKSWKSHLFGFPQNQWKSFEGQSYWVTGGGTGYGQAIAVTLAAAGAQVFLTGRRADKLQETIAEIRSLGIATENIHAVPADITDTEAVQAAIRKIESLCDGLDGVVNNAALPSTPGNDSPLRKDPKEHWERMLATNVTGAWDLTRNILDHLIKSGRPRVLFIGSGAGWAGTAGVGPYNVSKAAQNSLCQSLAAEFARDLPEHDVQVNTLVAGEARTEMNQGSDVSPYVIVRMALLLLAQDRGGPNGCFFSAEGDHLSCGESAPHGEPLMEVKKEYDGPVTSRLEAQQLKRACLHQFFTYDDGDDDNRYLEAFATCLPELHKFLAQSPGGELAIYGAGKLTDYFLRKHPAAVKLVNCIIDDDPAKWDTTLHGLPVVALEDLPEAVENVLVTSTKAEILFKMQAALKAHREELNHFDFSVAAQLMPGAIPARAWQNHEYSIYPVEIPEVKFEKDRDLLLLEMPPRYMPFLPYGIGCVHEIIKGKTDLNFETMDLNIMWYHRYHMARILDGVQKTDWPEGDQIDPWESTVAESWDNAEIPSEYQANDDAESKRTNRAVAYFREQLDELIDAIVEARPRMLGFSLNLNNTVMVHEVIKGVRKRLPDVLVLVGGYAFYSHKLSLARNSELYDYVVVSEGEYSLPPLIKKLQESFETGEMPKDLPGILSRFDSPDRKWGAMPNVSDLSNHAFPRYDWLPYNFYRTYGNNHTVPTCTSRGCSWSRCKFCCECANYYNRKPEEFVNELEWHVKQGAHTFNLFESDINGDHDNLQNIMREIVRRGLKINIYGQFRIDRRNTPEFFRDLKAAGFSMVRFGVDGWTDNSLKKQCKSCNMKIVEQNLKDATEAGLLCNVNMVLGVPGETEQDVEESYQNIVRLKPYINMFETLNMLRVACGSEYFENPDKFKIRFREDRDEIYKKHKVMLPENLWYSEDPYIDDEVRVQRFRRIVRGCHEGGVVLGDYIKWSVVQEVNRIEGTNETDFETVIYAEPKKKRDSNGEVELSTINNFGLQGDELEATAVEEEEPAAEGCGKDDCCQIETDETAEPATNGSCCGSEEPIEEPVVEAESEAEPEPQPEIAEAPMAEMKQRADGLWYANGDEVPFSGRAIAWHAVDRMQIEITLRDGSMDGPHRTWHENGQAEVETTFVQGTEHGRHVEFYDNGQVKWESVYEGGEIISLKGWREDGEQRELPQWERDGTPKLLVAAPTE